jgi:predicted enzyme related to lactoylglutathione lyase
MQLLDHVSITVRDLKHAKPFYKAVFTALGAVVAYEELMPLTAPDHRYPVVLGHLWRTTIQASL